VTLLESTNPLQAFQWSPQPQAEALIRELVEEFLASHAFARKLKERLFSEAAVRFSDLVEEVVADAERPGLSQQLSRAGFLVDDTAGVSDVYVHPRGIFPRVRLVSAHRLDVAMKVESVADFIVTHELDIPIQADPLASVRTAEIADGPDHTLSLIERHGSRRLMAETFNRPDAVEILWHAEAFRARRRRFPTDSQGFAHAEELVDAAIASIGVDRACDLFFAAEREYWQRRNRAAQIQKARQDKLGIGWANHDHHTYRSSRQHFAPMIAIFEKLGFHCRERFYAGAQAGWGAQVLEQPVAGIIIFADVDLSPDELYEDFAHDGLAPRERLGTVGLWCALHGEAFLEAGMHHLECQFAFEPLKEQLESREAIKVMKPFTDFPYLRQAFTEGETWPVRPERIDRLLKGGRISAEQAARFREKGAIGSHLENLERNQGFKGFNQTGVSEIIARTDPRVQVGQH
jgi:hypothetical protein